MVKKASEYDQEIPQSHTADQHTHREEAPQNTDSSVFCEQNTVGIPEDKFSRDEAKITNQGPNK